MIPASSYRGTVVEKLLEKKRFLGQLSKHRQEDRIDPTFVRGLPYASLQPRVLDDYLRVGEDFVAFCVANKFPILPITYESLTSYVYRRFRLGQTVRSFNGLTSKISWYVVNVLHDKPLKERDPVGHAAFLKAKRAMAKFDFSVARKSAPLYLNIIMDLKDRIGSSTFYFSILVLLAIQHAFYQRMGELTGGKARLFNLRHHVTPHGRFYCFFYLANNRPKAHKTKNAPYALLSERNNRFAYDLLSLWRYSFHANSSEDDFLFPHFTAEDKAIRTSPLSFDSAVAAMKTLLRRAGYNEKLYGGHSARRGGFIDRPHVPLHVAAIQGHWSAETMTHQREYGHVGLLNRLKYF